MDNAGIARTQKTGFNRTTAALTRRDRRQPGARDTRAARLGIGSGGYAIIQRRDYQQTMREHSNVISGLTENAAPSAIVEMSFAANTSVAYGEALALCRENPGFTTSTVGDVMVHTLALPMTEIALILRLHKLVGDWKSFRLKIDGQAAEPRDLLNLGGGCYAQRQTSRNLADYCFGDNQLECNLWGCKRLGMPLDADGDGWLNYGAMDDQGVWTFDKARIRRDLEAAMAASRLCPALDQRRVLATLKRLPDRVDPLQTVSWVHDQPAGSTRPKGIRPVLKHMPALTLGDPGRNWDFEGDDAVTQIHLGDGTRGGQADVADNDGKTVKIDMRAILLRRAAPSVTLHSAVRMAEPSRLPLWVVVAGTIMLLVGILMVIL
jgi:hypothetical protein